MCETNALSLNVLMVLPESVEFCDGAAARVTYFQNGIGNRTEKRPFITVTFNLICTLKELNVGEALVAIMAIGAALPTFHYGRLFSVTSQELPHRFGEGLLLVAVL